MAGAWCALEHWYMVSHGKKIHQCKFYAVIETATMTQPKTWKKKKNLCYLTHVFLSPFIHPSIHPSLPVSTAFAFCSHIGPLPSLPLRLFNLLNCHLMFLSTLSNPWFASDTHGRPGEEQACNRSWLSRLYPHSHKHRVIFEWFCQMKKERERKQQWCRSEEGAGGGTGWVEWRAGNWQRPWTTTWICSWDVKNKRGIVEEGRQEKWHCISATGIVLWSVLSLPWPKR